MNDKVNFQYYALAYIDVLNQTEHLKNINKLHITEEEKQEFIVHIKNTFGIINGFRNLFSSFFDGRLKAQEYCNDKLKELKGDKKVIMRKFGNMVIKKQLFSDTVIYYTPLAEGYNHVPIVDILRIFQALSFTFIAALAAKLAVRGSFEAGIGSDLFENEIYGPVLYHAHRLESEKAYYPRIVIGEELFEYIQGEMKNNIDNIEFKLRKKYASKCFKMLCKDVDGTLILDYLGAEIRNITIRDTENKEIHEFHVNEAYKFISSEYNRFLSNDDNKLAGRYYLLKNYFSERIGEYWQ